MKGVNKLSSAQAFSAISSRRWRTQDINLRTKKHQITRTSAIPVILTVRQIHHYIVNTVGLFGKQYLLKPGYVNILAVIYKTTFSRLCGHGVHLNKNYT